MVPIELADPVITSIRNAELRAKLDRIISQLGTIPGGQQPIHNRLIFVEDSIKDVSKHMSWEARITDNFDVVIKYEKLVSGNPKVISIDYSITPYVKYNDGQVLRQKVMKKGTSARNAASEGGVFGEFFVENLSEKMKSKLEFRC